MLSNGVVFLQTEGKAALEELEKHLETEKSTNSALRKALEEVSISRS